MKVASTSRSSVRQIIVLGIASVVSLPLSGQEPVATPAGVVSASSPDPTATPVPVRSPEANRTRPPETQLHAPSGSLGEAAKRARETPKPAEETAKKKSLGTITNESLKKPGSSGTTATAGKGTKATPAPTRPTSTPVALYVQRDDAGRTEGDWKKLVKGAKDRITQTENRIRQLETESARLENDFYAWSDGNYRDRVIKPAWDKSRDDLQQARKDLDSANQNWDNMQEVARKAGAPPGWLR
jgi:hypothetical protein